MRNKILGRLDQIPKITVPVFKYTYFAIGFLLQRSNKLYPFLKIGSVISVEIVGI